MNNNKFLWIGSATATIVLLVGSVVATESRYIDTSELKAAFLEPSNEIVKTNQEIKNIKINFQEHRIEYAQGRLFVLKAMPKEMQHEFQQREILRLEGTIDYSIRQIETINGG